LSPSRHGAVIITSPGAWYALDVQGLILVIEDEVDLATTLEYNFSREGYQTRIAHTGNDGLDAALRDPIPDAIVLDLMLPDISGTEVYRRLRENERTREIPVLMCTAKGSETDKIVGLELGADDYLAKPFNPRELLARVRAILRRAQAGQPSARDHFRSGELEIHFAAHEVTLAGKRQVLTHFEFELLTLLAKAAGRVLSREHLLDALKGEEYETFDRSIDVHVSKLRGKIEPNPKEPRFIKTVRGVGYVLTRDGD
jgi:two-component system phosphate regulon response regulator OmpR